LQGLAAATRPVRPDVLAKPGTADSFCDTGDLPSRRHLAVDFSHPFPGPQTYVFHCHNLEHEDGGMMLRVSVA
jgi:FtsP/CotA-like multicopper oxidase with cupredoxin domain